MNLENDPQKHIDTKLNHSGNLTENMQELPGRDFDKTSLREAVDQGLINVPETTEAVGSWTPSTETTPSTIEKKKGKGFSKRQRIIAGVAGLSLAAVGYIGAKSMNGSDEQVAPVGPVATAPAVPTSGETVPTATKTEQTTPASGEVAPNVNTPEGLAAFIDTYKISGTTFEEVAQSYVDKKSAWLNTGLTIMPDLATANYGAEGMVPIVEAKYAGITSNLYTESESGRAMVSNYEQNFHKDIIQEYWISMSRGDANPYVYKIEATGFKLISSDNPDFDKATTFTADVITHGTDNGNQNVAQNRIEHGLPAQSDIIRDDRMTFVRDSIDAPYKLDAESLNQLTNNSK